jgi:DNA-binding transcriptional MerR regulator
VNRRFYRAGQFAQKATVSIRTLHHYDREGLLSPSGHTESGYRLYTDNDLAALERILALKFLGFSLEEIRALVQSGPQSLQEVLAQQKEMMCAKRSQLDSIIAAIEKTEKVLQTGECDWDDLVHLIKEIQMDQNKEWVKKYFTPEQLQQMGELTAQSYSESAWAKLAEVHKDRAPWTEEDQKRVSAQWEAVYAEARRLTAAGADPAGDEALALAQQHNALVSAFTGGDPEVAAAVKQWWEKHNALPEAQRPLPQFTLDSTEDAFLKQALAVFQERQKQA